jgi:hypothetical protein
MIIIFKQRKARNQKEKNGSRQRGQTLLGSNLLLQSPEAKCYGMVVVTSARVTVATSRI